MERGVRVDHARGNGRVVFPDSFFEALDLVMHFVVLHENLGAAAPDHHQPLDAVVGLEALDVFAHFQHGIPLALGTFDVGAFEAAHVVAVENRGHRLDGLERVRDLVEQFVVQDASVDGRVIGVLWKDIPAAEDQAVDVGQRHEVFDERRAFFGALAKADGAHLGQRANGLADAGFDGFDAGDNRGGHRAHAGNEDAEFARGRGDGLWLVHGGLLLYRRVVSFVRKIKLEGSIHWAN